MTDEEIRVCHESEELRLALGAIRVALACHRFVVANEAELQRQVHQVIAKLPRAAAEREVRAARGAGVYDIRVQWDAMPRPFVIVLELKVRGSAAAVERQAQRYAMTEDVDAVVVVTTSQRLQRELLVPRHDGGPPNTLGGKPFRAFAVRAF